MIWALFSDIHGNLEALQAVLADMERQGPLDGRLCLGDVVGYGASPEECVELVRQSGAETIRGNHDEVAAGLSAGEDFNETARQAALWTRDQLSKESRDWLATRPLTIQKPTFRLVHSAPRSPELFDYILDSFEAAAQFPHFQEKDCFFGHSHYPGLYMETDDGAESFPLPPNQPISLAPDSRHLINVGSVGQPRDSDPRAAWVLFDDVMRTLTLRRVTYDVVSAQKKILLTGLPAFLAFRLEVGG